MQGMQSTPGQPGTAPAAWFSATIFRPVSRGLGALRSPGWSAPARYPGQSPPDCASAIRATGLNLAVVMSRFMRGSSKSRERPEHAARHISAGGTGERTCNGRAGLGSSSAYVRSQRKLTCARKAAILVLTHLGPRANRVIRYLIAMLAGIEARGDEAPDPVRGAGPARWAAARHEGFHNAQLCDAHHSPSDAWLLPVDTWTSSPPHEGAFQCPTSLPANPPSPNLAKSNSTKYPAGPAGMCCISPLHTRSRLRRAAWASRARPPHQVLLPGGIDRGRIARPPARGIRRRLIP